MDLYPAIDIRGGRCVRLVQGDFDRETRYSDDPVAMAQRFDEAGAPWIHVVDLDAARRTGGNRDIVGAIARAVTASVQTGGGVRDGSLLDAGVDRVVLGSAAVEDPLLVERLASAYPHRIAVGLDHRGGEVRVDGWESGTGLQLLDAVRRFSIEGVAAFVVTDIGRDGMLRGPDIAGLGSVLAATDVPVIASGGIATVDDLRMLADLGCSGAIVGMALYEGRIELEEAIAACER